jgi:hypothetical protein
MPTGGPIICYAASSLLPSARSPQQADLGQFERFRRVLHSPKYRVLLSHVGRRVLSTLHTSEQECRQRVRVAGFRGQEGGEFTMTLKREFGGRNDGVWLTTRLECDAYWPTAPQDPDGV